MNMATVSLLLGGIAIVAGLVLYLAGLRQQRHNHPDKGTAAQAFQLALNEKLLREAPADYQHFQKISQIVRWVNFLVTIDIGVMLAGVWLLLLYDDRLFILIAVGALPILLLLRGFLDTRSYQRSVQMVTAYLQRSPEDTDQVNLQRLHGRLQGRLWMYYGCCAWAIAFFLLFA